MDISKYMKNENEKPLDDIIKNVALNNNADFISMFELLEKK